MSAKEMLKVVPHISVVIPVYNSADCLNQLVKQVTEAVEKITENFEIVLIEDCGGDNSWDVILSLGRLDKRVKGVQLSRNFGQHHAITAGLTYATGDYVVVMDCDLQEDPKYIRDLYDKSQQGFDIVYAKKQRREYSRLRNVVSVCFHRFFSFMSDFDIDPNIGSFSILTRKVVNAFLQFGDYRRAYLMVLRWLGFKSAFVEVKHRNRYSGSSSYTLMKLLNQALNMIIAYSDKPLRLSIYLGAAFSSLSFLGVIYLVLRYVFEGFKEGWTSLIVMTTLVGGLIMFFLGVLGLYIAKIFEQVKGRPLFLVQSSINMENVSGPKQNSQTNKALPADEVKVFG